MDICKQHLLRLMLLLLLWNGLYEASASLLDDFTKAHKVYEQNRAVPAQVEAPAVSATPPCSMLGSVRLGRKDWADVLVTTLCRLTGHCQCASGPSPDLTGNCIKAVLSESAFRACLSLPADCLTAPLG